MKPSVYCQSRSAPQGAFFVSERPSLRFFFLHNYLKLSSNYVLFRSLWPLWPLMLSCLAPGEIFIFLRSLWPSWPPMLAWLAPGVRILTK